MDELVQTIWNSVSSVVSGKLDESKIIVIVPHIIAQIEKLKQKESGAWKRSLCISVIRLAMEKNDFTTDQVNNILCVAGSVVDTLISIAKNQVDIGKTVRKCCLRLS